MSYLWREAEVHIRSYQARIDFEGWSDDLCIEICEAFAKAQRREEVEAIRKFCIEWLSMAEADKADAEGSGLYNMFQGRVQALANFRDWLDQRKKELGDGQEHD